MTSGWVKSLQCKSRAVDDVVNSSKQHYHSLISPSASCRKSVNSFNDVVDTRKNKPKKHKTAPAAPVQGLPEKVKKMGLKKIENGDNLVGGRVRASGVTRHRHAPESFFPALTELPEGHPSRNVVEIIFHTSWTPKAFSGRIEMVFKVQNLTRTVARFEEYREVVKSKAVEAGLENGSEDHARCVADGNEVMRFHCLGPTNSGPYDPSGGAWTFHAGRGAAICTFSGSGGAHESAGGGKGRRAMMVCRVIAGRVGKRVGFETKDRVGCDSVSGENNELLVFDSHAVLPCFLIIYKL
ncbi:Poly(ADP-ribose) polymerase, catalytic domain containing protein [Heracleum sosnowskyi]|uniref:Poly(ADP-ribose) polymerase, catalytic domain containing protein n=1 Tax=Heracleum sosnowskyi TaxID=360622 RepID=A0AAD8ICC3_9APIA|nr:Poly(ADP-ribose) polymerase, catalytic domain containing protein [Heracleum sosnowskyi]